MKVTVFGIGYVGLVQAAVLAEVGHDVVCVDVDESKVQRLNAGEIPIFEPDLDTLVHRNVQEGRLRFTTDARMGVEHGHVQFIAVGTPPDEDGSADLKYVLSVGRVIAEHMSNEKVVVVKSTVPVGTGDAVRQAMNEVLANSAKAAPSFEVVSNPEFLKEGSAVADCMRPDRIVVGTTSKQAEQVLRQLYAPFNRNHEKFIVMDVRSAELTKYAANCMLATKISFINEIAMIAEVLGADVEQVRRGIGSDPRIGYQFIYPGIGYGGSCFPKDVQALIRTAEKAGADTTVLSAVEKRNGKQKEVMLEKVKSHFGRDLSGRTFGLWGLAFKPNTDDMREAPARVIMEGLWHMGAKVKAYDPEAMEECRRIYGDRDDLVLVGSKEDAVAGVDALIIATEWKIFQAIDLAEMRDTMEQPVIFDGRNLYDPALLKQNGFVYHSIGRSLPDAA